MLTDACQADPYPPGNEKTYPTRRKIIDSGGDLLYSFPLASLSNEQKPWLVGLYRGLYYPVI